MVEPFKFPTGQNWDADAPIYRYDVDELPGGECCTLEAGWISIFSLYNGEDDCWMLWLNSFAGDGFSLQIDLDTSEVTEHAYDQGMCLTGTYEQSFGACCDDETGTCDDDIEALNCPHPLRHVENTFCIDLDPPCGQALGACCHADATCDLVDGAALCVEEGDIWLGRNTMCDECPCRIPMPDGAVLESEPCDDTGQGRMNDGCNMDTTPTFEPITVGVPVYGTAWALAGSRDTDWYEVTVDEPTSLIFSVTAEFLLAAGMIEYEPGLDGTGNCDNITGYISPFETAQPCGYSNRGSRPAGRRCSTGSSWRTRSTRVCHAARWATTTWPYSPRRLPPCPWDFDGNGFVGPVDVGIIKNNLGCDTSDPDCAVFDLDGNGFVGPVDVGEVKNNLGPCPE